MAKIFNGKVLFASAMQPTGAQPLDDRVVVQSYSDLVDVTTFGDAKYLGMIVGVVDDSKLYMLTNTDVTAQGAWKEIGAGGAVSVETYAEAVALASDENIGQVIYVKTKSSYDADGEGEGAAVEYDAAPYIVIGEGALQKLAASTASGDIEGDVAELTTKVSGLETAVGNAEGGLVKDVADLKGAVEALHETFVTDVKDASGNSLVVDGVATLGDYATKAELESAIGGIDFSTLATKTEVNDGLALKVDASVYDEKMAQVDASLAEKVDASLVYTKDEVDGSLNLKANAADVYSKTDADSTFVKSEGYVAFSEDEKNKLAGIAEGAEVNYINSVGDNLSVIDGKLEVSIPEVEVPFQSVAEGDKVLALNDGVLSSTLSYAREEVEGVDSLVLKGIDGVVIGSVPVADFIADGMLESVAPKADDPNIFIFTFNSAAGSKSFEVDFSKYVDTYHADGDTIELGEGNIFSVKDGVFEAAGAAAQALADAKADAASLYQPIGNYEAAGAAAVVEAKLDEYKTSNNAAVAGKVDSSVYDAKVAAIDGSISSINGTLADKANAADVYTSTEVDELLAAKVNSSDYDAKVAEIDSSISSINTEIAKKADASTVETALNGKVDVVEGSSLVSDELITKLGNMVEIKSVSGDLTFTDGALSLDLSEYAKSDDVANTYVAKEEGKGLSANDLTDDLLAKLNGIAEGAEVNYVKSVGTNLSVSDAGELTVDLSALATSEALTNGLAAKLDASAKVNGVSFVNGEATLDAGDIALESAITRTENGEEKSVYEATASIQSVLANLSARIDTLDPNISGEFGVSAVNAGNGIEVTGAANTPTIAVKVSATENNVAEVKTDGVYVQDMRSYWEAI